MEKGKEKEITAMLFKDEKLEVVTIKTGLQSLYDVLGVGLIEFAYHRIGKTEYTFICDEEGLLKESPLSLADGFGEPLLVGNFLIVNTKGDDIAALTDEDIKNIRKNTEFATSRKGHKVLMLWRR